MDAEKLSEEFLQSNASTYSKNEARQKLGGQLLTKFAKRCEAIVSKVCFHTF